MTSYPHIPDNPKRGNPECIGCGATLYRLDGQFRHIAHGSLVCQAAIDADAAAAVAEREVAEPQLSGVAAAMRDVWAELTEDGHIDQLTRAWIAETALARLADKAAALDAYREAARQHGVKL